LLAFRLWGLLMPLSRWKPGDGPTAGRLNETVRAINSARLSGPMAGRRRPAGRPISSQDPRPLWAKLAGASSPYTFVEQIETDAAGTWADGPATGTAYEVNNVAGLADEVHRIHPDGFGKYRFQSLKYSNGCPVTLTLTAKCGDSGSSPTNLSGALVELLDSAGTTVLASGTGSLTYAADGTKAYQSRVTLSGYHTKTYPLGVIGCTTPRAVSVYTWPTTMTVTLRTYILGSGFPTPANCDLPGATVTVAGSMSGSAVSNGSGIASLTMSTSSASHRQFCTVAVTAPAGYGTANRAAITLEYPARTATGLWPCTDTATIEVRVFNRSDHVPYIASGRFVPINWNYSDDYGTGTLALFTTTGIGIYTYVSNESIVYDGCTPMHVARDLPHQTNTVDVGFQLQFVESCGSATWTANRQVNADILFECPPSTAEVAALQATSFAPETPDPANAVSQTTATGSTISLTFSVGPFTIHKFGIPTPTYAVPESAVTATFTATVL
jgi:hypothetical protein